jgi:hypothetical protein
MSPSGFSGPLRLERTHGTEVPQSVSDLSPALRSRITAPIMGFYLASSMGMRVPPDSMKWSLCTCAHLRSITTTTTLLTPSVPS